MEQKYRRITVKIGSNVLTRKDGTLDVTRMSAIVDQVAELRKLGIEIILVSSGAVASGRSELKVSRKMDSVDQRQLFSAVGQAKLIRRYYDFFKEHHIAVGQVLTMKENFGTRRHYLNQRNCMMVMLDNGVITTPAHTPLPERLEDIYNSLHEIIELGTESCFLVCFMKGILPKRKGAFCK